jgi:phosphoribosyl-AMP cyclohydrolase / phosphoribosyl-ATP pyrophosphohydrolase
MNSARIASTVAPSDVHWGPDGLVPGIVQDAQDGTVLMLGWLDAEALAATLASGLVHFHSRSRDRLWRKGETSGHELRLVDVALDCDADALLLTALPQGPTCHTGARSCFDRPGATDPTPAQGFAWLERLWTTIVERAASRLPGSYTAQLLEGGVDAVGRKVVEEATEVLVAAKDDAVAETFGADRATTRDALAAESADLLYHLLVMSAERGLPPAEMIKALRARHARGPAGRRGTGQDAPGPE